MTEEELKALAAKKAEEAENYKKAMNEERTKRSELSAKLIALENDKATELEQKKIESKAYEKKIADLTAKVSEYEPVVTEFNEFKTKVKAETESKVNEYLTKIPEAELEFVKLAIEWKDWSSQIKLLEGFANKFKTPVFTDDKVDEKKKKDVGADGDRFTELSAKIKAGKASPSEKWEYLTLLR